MDMNQNDLQILEQKTSIMNAMEATPFPVLLGRDGVFLFANKHALKLLEADSLELIRGKHVIDFTHETSYQHTIKELAMLKRGIPQSSSLKNIMTMKGNVLEIETVVSKITVNGEKLDYIIVKDSSESSRLQHRYLMQKKHYQTLIDNSIDTVALVTDNVFQYINKAGLKLFKAQHESEIIGRSVLDFIHPRDHEDVKQRTINVIDHPNGPAERVEREFIRLDGTSRFVESVVMPFNIDNKPSLQVILRDITENKQQHQHTVKNEKLLTAGQLSAGIAHEIRNPLTSIKGFLQLLETKIPEENQRYAEIMREEIDKIERITGEMLSLSKSQAIIRTQHNIITLIDQVVTLLEPQATLKNVVINNTIDDQEIVIQCDKQQIKQVFINIMKNAIESMEDGGDVSVGLSVENGRVEVTVTDEGCGIPKSLLGQITEPFFTTKGTGTGLGLTICNRILKEYGGELRIDSTEGQGTVFTVVFPFAN
ncbi:PAS domain S-box protein [Rossellomorea vietnamensis]|uniref:histidine kinase n=2 Tax=Rossellomorea vietnamensis TaxID=218284 RepID=A0A5D4NY01_9BACI|nr:PAS domain S-box protein [Rossellomorea vietnamensis]